MSKKTLLFIAVVIILGIYHYETKPSMQGQATATNSCDQNLWNHVYNPDRLQVISQCRTVTGTIALIRKEKDGDFHMQLNLDPEFKDMLNQKNIDEQDGNLVLEPVCVGPVSQEDAIDSCKDYTSNAEIPSVGDHVEVTGSYVLDTSHGWKEIHPVSSFKQI